MKITRVLGDAVIPQLTVRTDRYYFVMLIDKDDRNRVHKLCREETYQIAGVGAPITQMQPVIVTSTLQAEAALVELSPLKYEAYLIPFDLPRFPTRLSDLSVLSVSDANKTKHNK